MKYTRTSSFLPGFLRYWQNAERVSTFFKSFNQPSLEQGYIQEDQDFFCVFVPMKNQYQSILTINLWIYLYYEEQERFRDSCFNCREIANQLQLIWNNWHFGCIRLMGRGLVWDGAISGIAFLYWAPQPTSIHPPTRRKPKLLPKTTKSCHKLALPLGRGTLFGENERYCKHSDF